MRRSELNRIMRNAVEFLGRMNFALAPFAYWSQDDWRTKGHQYDEIRDNMLGWRVTDYGSGDFRKTGLLMFTLRNGNLDTAKYTKPYCEKILIVEEEQVTPFHFHWNKMEGIINQGGGNLLIQLYNSTEYDQLADTPVTVLTDGRKYMAPAGTMVRLTPGESITLMPRVYHKFWGEPSKGTVLAGEVSKVYDDRVDDRFLDKVGRFPETEEDGPPLYLLANEYPPVGS